MGGNEVGDPTYVLYLLFHCSTVDVYPKVSVILDGRDSPSLTSLLLGGGVTRDPR